MLYRFVKKDGNVERIGDIDAPSLETKLQGYLDNGFELAEVEEYDQQVIGAVNAQLETANAKIVELEAALQAAAGSEAGADAGTDAGADAGSGDGSAQA